MDVLVKRWIGMKMQEYLPHDWMLDVLRDMKTYANKKGLIACEDAIGHAQKIILTELLEERDSKRVDDGEFVDASAEMRKVLMFTTHFRGQLF